VFLLLVLLAPKTAFDLYNITYLPLKGIVHPKIQNSVILYDFQCSMENTFIYFKKKYKTKTTKNIVNNILIYCSTEESLGKEDEEDKEDKAWDDMKVSKSTCSYVL